MSATAEPAGFPLKPLPLWLRAANSVAELWDGQRGTLTPERVMADAGALARLPPEFPAHVRESLDVLCRSLHDEASLHWLGVANARNLLVSGLAELLRIERAFVDDPSLASQPLVPPVIVVGLPRSGTTFLHRLLSAPADAIGVAMYQHIYPLPLARFDDRLLRARALFYPWLSASRTYDIDSMHYVRTELPDECNLGMRLGGRSVIYWATSPTHTYLRWLLAQDLRESYRLYRKVLQLHQRANPGRRLTLKCPHHMAWLPALFEALPEAIVVETHRDPVECVPSECKLILSLHGISVRDLDWRRTVESNHVKVSTYARRAVEFARGPTAERIHHVDYRRLVKDPVGVARDVFARAGLPWSDAHRHAIAGYAAENRQHKHGKNRYEAADFGLDPRVIAKAFADYTDCFLSTPPS